MEKLKFNTGGTADSSNTGANMGGTMGSSVMKKGGGVFRDFYEGQSIIVEQELSTKLDKSVQKLFNKFSNKELVIDKIEKNTPYNTAKVFNRNTGEKAPFEIILNPKYVEQYRKGGNLIGKQKNLDLNKNGKLDSEDFKMLKGEKYAKGSTIKSGGGSTKGGWIGTKVYRKLDKKEFKVDDFKNYGSYQELFVKSNDGERIEITLGHPYKENDFLNNWSTNKMANGGLANVPESFPETDAMSYKTGGGVGNLSSNAQKVLDRMAKAKVNRYKVYDFTVKRWADELKIKLSKEEIEKVAEAYSTNPKYSFDFDKMARGGYLEGREEYEGYNYKIFYNPRKGMYSVDDEIGIFKGDNNYFEKYEQAKEHAEISIRSMLYASDKMVRGGGLADVPESFPETDAMSYKTGGSTVKDNRMNERTRAVILKIQKTGIHPDDVSPNFVNEIAYDNGIELKSEEVVFISDNYGKKSMANGGSTKGFEYSIGGL